MKVAITGASGWLARSAFAALMKLKSEGMDVSCTMFSKSPKQINLRDNSSYTPLPLNEIMDHQFDLYVPLAFLTQEKHSLLGGREYVSRNLEIIRRDVEVLTGRRPARVLLISSGVVKRPSKLHNEAESYRGYADLKKLQEDQLRDVMGDANLSICYLYSCTSVDLPDWQNYAFSSLIHDALHEKKIVIRNPMKVTRRYVDSRDLFYAMFKALQAEQSFTISSGGPLVELEELAHLVVKLLGSNARVSRATKLFNAIADEYCAVDDSMEDLFLRNQVKCQSIEQQIINTSKIFLNS